MNDTEYHARIVRLPVGGEVRTHRAVMTPEETQRLLTGHVYVTEKLDGRLTVHHRVSPDLPDQYDDYFYEDLRIRHSVFYDQLTQH